MNDDAFSELMLGAVIIGIAFTWLYPGSALLSVGVVALSLMGVFFLLKGVIELLRGKGTSHFWMGTAMLLTVIILFKSGMGTVMGIFNALGAVISSII
jgi:hypothetical protein